MKLRKAIFVTILVVVMLAVIDACLCILCNPAFIALTGSVVVYGLLRGACDFYHWLSKPDPAPKRLTKQAALAEAAASEGVYDWADDEDLVDSPQPARNSGKDAAIMRVLDEEV